MNCSDSRIRSFEQLGHVRRPGGPGFGPSAVALPEGNDCRVERELVVIVPVFLGNAATSFHLRGQGNTEHPDGPVLPSPPSAQACGRLRLPPASLLRPVASFSGHACGDHSERERCGLHRRAAPPPAHLARLQSSLAPGHAAPSTSSCPLAEVLHDFTRTSMQLWPWSRKPSYPIPKSSSATNPFGACPATTTSWASTMPPPSLPQVLIHRRIAATASPVAACLPCL